MGVAHMNILCRFWGHIQWQLYQNHYMFISQLCHSFVEWSCPPFLLSSMYFFISTGTIACILFSSDMNVLFGVSICLSMVDAIKEILDETLHKCYSLSKWFARSKFSCPVHCIISYENHIICSALCDLFQIRMYLKLSLLSIISSAAKVGSLNRHVNLEH